MKLQHLSPSSVDTYDMCNYSYKLRYQYGLKGFPNLGSTKGTICHSVFENVANKKMEEVLLTSEEIEDSLIYNFDKEFGSKEGIWLINSLGSFDKKVELDDCRQLITKITGAKKNVFDYKILAVEKEIDLILRSDGGIVFEDFGKEFLDSETGRLDKNIDIWEIFGKYVFRLYGFVDLVVEIDKNTLQVIDWKTGKSSKSFKQLQKDTQMLVYSLAMQYLYPEYTNYIVTVNYLRKKPITLCFDNSDMVGIINKLYSKWSKIYRCNDMKRTIRGYNAKWKCNFCAFCGGKEDCDIFYLLDSNEKPLDKAIEYAKIGKSLETLI